jgi:hypothetical protein
MTLFALLAAALVPVPAAIADPSPATAIAELNHWRAQLGEAPVSTTDVPAWDTGCAHHNNYEQVNNQTLGHFELAGNPAYTDDGAVAGPDSVLAEEIHSPHPAPDEALLPGPVWDGAVFHRAALLEPRLANIGFSATTFQSGTTFTSWQCLWVENNLSDNPPLTPPLAIDDTRTTPTVTLYPSPANGAFDVPTTFTRGTESPDPASETGVPAGATLGWLMNVEINGPWAKGGNGGIAFAHDVSATLGPDGTNDAVPVVVSECGTTGCAGNGVGGTSYGIYFGGGFGIFPTRPLAANTTYRVTATGTVTDLSAQPSPADTPFSIAWCFSTGTSYTPSGDCSAAAPGTGGLEPVVVPSSPKPPAVSGGSLKLKGKPRLTFTVTAGAGGPSLTAIKVTGPPGISFARRANKLVHGVAVGAAGQPVGFSVTGGRALMIRLAHPAPTARVTVVKPALLIGNRLARRIRHHRLGRLTFTLAIVDAANTTTRLALTLR